MDVGNFDASSKGEGRGAGEAESSRSSSVGEEPDLAARTDRPRAARRGRAGGGGGRRMLWRWPLSRRLEQAENSAILGDVNVNTHCRGTGTGTGGGGASNRSRSPCRSPLRSRDRKDLDAAPSGDTTAAVTKSTSAPPVAYLRRRTPLPFSRSSSAGGSPAHSNNLSNRSNRSGSPECMATGANNARASVAPATTAAAVSSRDVDDINPCLLPVPILNGGSNGYDVVEPESPTTSIGSDSGSTPGWAERVGLTGGVAVAASGARTRTAAPARGVGREGFTSCTAVRKRSPLGNELPVTANSSDGSSTTAAAALAALAKNNGNREVPRFLRPVVVLLTLSLLAIGGARLFRASSSSNSRGSGIIRISRGGGAGGAGWGGGVVLFGPAVYAAGGVQLPEAVVDDIFERADKDHDGVIGDEEIQYLVEGAGGSLLDDASEIKAGVASVIKNLDRNSDQALSRSDLNTYWDRLGTLLTVDEAAQWVLHAAQLPQEVADAFVNNMVTGYDFPELAARQGALLEQDLGVTRPAFKRNLVRSMQWKLWGMGEEPAPPTGLRAANATCGAVSVDWDQTTPTNSELSFPVHKYVLRRAMLGREGEQDGDWVTVMAGPNGAFFDAGLRPGAAYRYALQAWNALGHSSSVKIDVVVATEGCRPASHWFWPSGGLGGVGSGAAEEEQEASLGGLIVATLVLPAAALCFRALRGGGGGGGDGGNRAVSSSLRSTSSSSFSLSSMPGGGQDRGSVSGSIGNSGSSRREAGRRRRPEALIVGAGAPSGKATAASEGRGHGTGINGSPGSPTSVEGNGSNGSSLWSDKDRDHAEKRSMTVGNSGNSNINSKSLSLRLAPSKDRIRWAGSDVAAPGGAVRMSSTGDLGLRRPQGGGGPSSAAIGESVRRQQRIRMLTSRRSSSRDDREVCKECHKEWKWYQRGRHTCCKCHEQFCDSKECGTTFHSFGACPVGGSCMCSSCL